jgi:hypothetical protein
MKRVLWLCAATLLVISQDLLPAHAQGTSKLCLKLQDDYRAALNASTDASQRRRDIKQSGQGQCNRDYAAAIQDSIKANGVALKAMRDMRNCMANANEVAELDRRARLAKTFDGWDRSELASFNVDCRWRR